MNKLDDLRKHIDDIDDQLVKLLAKRKDVVKSIGKIKAEAGKDPLDFKRKEELLEDKIKKAREHGLNEEHVKSLFTIIHDHSVELQKALKDKK